MLTWSSDSTYVCLTFLTCSCTFLESDNYLINHKKNNLHRVRGNLQISIYVRVYSGIRYVMQIKLPVRPEGLQVTEGSTGSLFFVPSWKRASYKTLLTPRDRFRPPATEQSWVMVPSMYGTHCKHSSLIPPLISSNSLDLLRCGCMCARMLLHIPRHMGRTSNKNKY